MAVRRYLNNAERDTCYIMSALYAWSRAAADVMAKYPQRKEIVKCLRLAGTWTKKAKEELLQPLDTKELAYVTAESNKVKVITKYTDDAIRELKAIENLNSTVKIDKDAFYTIVEFAIAGYCKRCKAHGAGEICQCTLRTTLMDTGVEALNCCADEDTCQYQDYEETAVETAMVDALMGKGGD